MLPEVEHICVRVAHTHTHMHTQSRTHHHPNAISISLFRDRGGDGFLCRGVWNLRQRGGTKRLNQVA